MLPKRARVSRRSRRALRQGGALGAPDERGAISGPVQRTLYGEGVPDVTHVTLKWAAHLTGATANSYGTTLLSANDVRDPGLSTAATTAQGYAQYSAIYARAMVVASRIKLRCSHGSTSSGVGSTATETTICVFPSRGTSTVNDMSSAMAQPGAVKVAFDIGGQKILRQKMDVARFLGLTRQQARAQESLWSTPSASPTTGLIWYIASISSCTQTGLDMVVDAELEFDVLFFSRASLDLAFEADLLKLVLARLLREQEQKARPSVPQLQQERKDVQPSEEKEVQVGRFSFKDQALEPVRISDDRAWIKLRAGGQPTPKPEPGKLGRP